MQKFILSDLLEAYYKGSGSTYIYLTDIFYKIL
jgi:hypothetical protein